MYQFYKNFTARFKALVFSLISIMPVVFFSSPVLSEGRPDVSQVLAVNPVGLGSMLQIFTGLAFIVMLIVGAAWLLRRYGNINGVVSGELKVIAGLSLGQREKVVIVKVGDEQLLIGVAPGRVQTLHILGKPIKEVSNVRSTDSFLIRLKDEMQKRKIS